MINNIVMIHGMFGRPLCWQPFSVLFKKNRFRVLTPALRYHDTNPGDAPDQRLGQTGIQEYIDDLRELITPMNPKPVVMGHSLGGFLALKLASEGLVSAAVLLAPVPPLGIPIRTPLSLLAFRSILMTPGFWHKPVRPVLSETAEFLLNNIPISDHDKAFDFVNYDSGKVLVELVLSSMGGSRATEVDLTKVTCPLLAIAGGKDRVIPTSIVRKIVYRLKSKATLLEFPELTHLLICEPGYKSVARAIIGWIQSVDNGESDMESEGFGKVMAMSNIRHFSETVRYRATSVSP